MKKRLVVVCLLCCVLLCGVFFVTPAAARAGQCSVGRNAKFKLACNRAYTMELTCNEVAKARKAEREELQDLVSTEVDAEVGYALAFYLVSGNVGLGGNVVECVTEEELEKVKEGTIKVKDIKLINFNTYCNSLQGEYVPNAVMEKSTVNQCWFNRN